MVVTVLMAVMVIIVIRTGRRTRTTIIHDNDRTTKTIITHGIDKRDNSEDRQDRQICHLNLTFQVTCVGQLSQFLRCLILKCH